MKRVNRYTLTATAKPGHRATLDEWEGFEGDTFEDAADEAKRATKVLRKRYPERNIAVYYEVLAAR